jgi:hypothetical protein
MLFFSFLYYNVDTSPLTVHQRLRGKLIHLYLKDINDFFNMNIKILAFHPDTADTPLSKPFQKRSLLISCSPMNRLLLLKILNDREMSFRIKTIQKKHLK